MDDLRGHRIHIFQQLLMKSDLLKIILGIHIQSIESRHMVENE